MGAIQRDAGRRHRERAEGLATYPETYDTRKSRQNPQVWTKSTVTFEGQVILDENPIAEPSDIIAVGAKPGWSWRDCCKTQYAHKHSRDHFFFSHLGMIRLLDYAKEIGILDWVGDDGEHGTVRVFTMQKDNAESAVRRRKRSCLVMVGEGRDTRLAV